jgi:hypothetical protein
MRIYRLAWRFAAVATGFAALAGTVATMQPEAFLAILFTMAMFGGVMGYAFKDDLPQVRHPILGGVVLFTTPALYPGLSQLLGAAAGGVIAVLVLTSPFVVDHAARHLRPRLVPSQVEVAGQAGPDEALQRQWTESTRQLNQAASLQDLLLIVHAREQILDELTDRTSGQLPDYVWDSRDGPGGHHPHTVRAPHPPR